MDGKNESKELKNKWNGGVEGDERGVVKRRCRRRIERGLKKRQKKV